ncbi:MAG: hypothetical protein R6V59_01660 [Dehalococcoidia bacterium]
MNHFLKGIKLSNFLDSIAEWHALVQGFAEVLCPWPPRHKEMRVKLQDEIQAEHHYYMAGRALGVLAWLAIIIIITTIFRKGGLF